MKSKPSTYQLPGVLFSMCLSLVLVVATVSAINLAIPNLAVSLRATNTQLTWIADAYTVVLAALVLPMGALGDKIGRRNVLTAGTFIFGTAALAASTVSTPNALIFCRTLMGLGAAMIMPCTLSTITSAFPANKRNRAVATWAGFASAGGVMGLLASGLLLEAWDWKAIFVASALLSIVAAVSAYFLAPNTKESKKTSIDYAGAVSLVALVGGLVYAIIEGNNQGWGDKTVQAACVISGLGLIAYIVSSLKNKNPLLDIRLFKLRGFTTGSLTVVAQFLAFFGFLFVGLQFLQLILGYSPLKSAVALIPVAMIIIPSSQLTPRLVQRFGSRVLMSAGMIFMAIGMWYLSRLGVNSSYLSFLSGLLVSGLGIGITGSTATTAITKSLSIDKQGVASAVNDTSREIGSALGVALMGSMYTSHYRDSLPSSLAQLPERANEAIRYSAAAGLEAAKHAGPEAEKVTQVVKAAFINGLSSALVLAALILVVSAAIVAFFGISKKQELRQD